MSGEQQHSITLTSLTHVFFMTGTARSSPRTETQREKSIKNSSNSVLRFCVLFLRLMFLFAIRSPQSLATHSLTRVSFNDGHKDDAKTRAPRMLEKCEERLSSACQPRNAEASPATRVSFCPVTSMMLDIVDLSSRK